MTRDNRQLVKSRAIIIGLALLFVLPILVSWYLVFFTDYHHGEGGYEHGELVTPARKLPDRTLLDPLTGEQSSLHGKWTMLASAGQCDDDCEQILYRMRQIRLAMGREMVRVQRAIWFANEKSTSDLQSLFTNYDGQLVLTKDESDAGFLQTLDMQTGESGAIHLVDPAGFYMMYYPADTDPGGIIKDLKRLLRISKLD